MISTACLFLAGKVEEAPKPLRDVVFLSYTLKNKDKLTTEEATEHMRGVCAHPQPERPPGHRAARLTCSPACCADIRKCRRAYRAVARAGGRGKNPTAGLASQDIFESEKEEILKAERRLLRALGFEV